MKSFAIGLCLPVLGVLVVEAAAYVGWLVGGRFGRTLAMAWLGYVAVALVLLLWLYVTVERRQRRMAAARVRWVWTRRDLVQTIARGMSGLPFKGSVLDVAHGPCWDGARYFPERRRRLRRVPVALGDAGAVDVAVKVVEPTPSGVV